MSDWHVIGASVSGTSHRRGGRGCDDAHAYRIHDKLVVLAAADGAGSAPCSALGASTVVQVVLDAAEQLLYPMSPAEQKQWLSVLTHILDAAHQALVTLVEQSLLAVPAQQLNTLPDAGAPGAVPSSLHDVATTLLVAIATPDWLAVAQVGDGAVVVQHADGSVMSLTGRSKQVHLDETDFITDEAYLRYSTCVVQPRADITGIALLTDGLQMIALHFPENTAHQPFFAPLFRFAGRADASTEELQRFLESDRICARTDDDKTLLLGVYQ